MPVLMKTKVSVKALMVVLVLLLLSAGCSRTVVTEELFLSYKVRAGTVLDIYNPNGEVTISGWEENEVEISVVKETYHGQDALDKVDIFIDIAEKMVIETEHPDSRNNVTVSYEIKLPEDVLVGVVDCSNGNINVQGVNGNPVISTSNGNVTVNEVKGIISARSSNGDLIVGEVNGLAYLRTSNGNIEADLPDVQEDLEIITSNGSIDLFIAHDLAVDLEANTSNGKISYSNLDIEPSLVEQTALIGEMNGGGPKLNISTSNGSIELAQLH